MLKMIEKEMKKGKFGTGALCLMWKVYGARERCMKGK